MDKSNNWCFTSWDFNRIMRINKDLFDIIVVGEELAPTTNKLHYQGFVISKKKYALAGIKKIIDPKGHFEPAYSDVKSCIDYCLKDGKAIIKKIIDPAIEPDIFDIFGINQGGASGAPNRVPPRRCSDSMI